MFNRTLIYLDYGIKGSFVLLINIQTFIPRWRLNFHLFGRSSLLMVKMAQWLRFFTKTFNCFYNSRYKYHWSTISVLGRPKYWLDSIFLNGHTLNGHTLDPADLYRPAHFDYTFWSVKLTSTAYWTNSWSLLSLQSLYYFG